MTPVVELAQVSFRYAGTAGRRSAPFGLTDVTLTIAPGEILGVIGPNSAGKTTLIRLLTKVLEPARGDIRLEGRALTTLARSELARRIAVVPQEVPAGLPFTVAELVLMGRYPHAPRRFFETDDDVATARRAMALTGVEELADAPVDSLSGGERQRVILARALAQDPTLLVLDEPTAHLDLRYQAECVGLLQRLNRERRLTVLLVSHDLNLAAEVADRLLLLADGRVAGLGPPARVLDEALIASTYGCPVRVESDADTGRPRVRLLYGRPVSSRL